MCTKLSQCLWWITNRQWEWNPECWTRNSKTSLAVSRCSGAWNCKVTLSSSSAVQICTLLSMLALKPFAACVEDRPDTPCLRYMDSPSQSLLRGESISLTYGCQVEPASRAAPFTYESARGQITEMSQHNDLPPCHGTSVRPSSRFP